MATTVPEGLRDRKKRERRDAIADVAMELFATYGFDAVTVADVAQAADVAQKTVFNYYPAKEDLVFRTRVQRRAELLLALHELPAGGSIVRPFRAMTMRLLDTVAHGPTEELVAVPRLVMGSETLRNGLLLAWEREAAELAPTIAAALGRADGDLAALVLARTLAWTHRLTFRTACQRLIAGDPQAAIANELRAQATETYDLIETGLGAAAPAPKDPAQTETRL